ncbi:FCD domain-containing protein [uncultured Microbacterium sp.]|uniref:FadR/GntR family transcriptional regulator n=1 Tax=uncultured Microbacterium sp. TaxID=191216 RepID=UPI0025F3B319|nr:FCD domain-containing protein [uncultured Microbacterium sp.]
MSEGASGAGSAGAMDASNPSLPPDPSIPSARAWEVVLDHIERELVAGRLAPGERLPSERDLSTRLGVGRSSVREALRVLEVMGLIRTATGSGPTAGATIVQAPADGIARLMGLHAAAQGFPVPDVVAARLVIEQHVARTLAERPDPERLAAAEGLLTRMDDPALSTPAFLELDTRFHALLAEASGNAVLAATMAGLRAAIEHYARAGAAGLPDWDRTAARLRGEHRGILEAIADGDADRAAARAHDHISGYYAEIDH